MLFRRMPVPGAITPEPEPFELDRLAMPPSASTALVWVVPVGRRAQSRSTHVLLAEVGVEALVADGVGGHAGPRDRPEARDVVRCRRRARCSIARRAIAISAPPDEGGGLVSRVTPR